MGMYYTKPLTNKATHLEYNPLPYPSQKNISTKHTLTNYWDILEVRRIVRKTQGALACGAKGEGFPCLSTSLALFTKISCDPAARPKPKMRIGDESHSSSIRRTPLKIIGK